MAEIEEIHKIIKKVSPYYAEKGGPSEEHKLVYDASTQTLEPVYFWIVDFMNEMFSNKVEKIVDNFASSPGSGHFAELGLRAGRMQEEAMKIMQTTGILTKSIINIIYDLREFQIRLQHYKDAESDDKSKKEAALLSLKEIWMNNVDMKKGAASINSLAQQLNFVTIRDAFMAAKSVKDVGNMDLNDRVKRILKSRVAEFFEWKDRSEKELTKRYELERTYLKNQVDALKLYSRWAKPYLKAASELKMKEFGREPALVKAFNTILLELTLLGKRRVDVKSAAIEEAELPKDFEKIKLKRNYHSCVLVDFRFRGVPQKTGQHYVFGGRADVVFRAYALNDDELALLEKELDKTDLKEALTLIEGATEESLEKMAEDINEFLEEDKKSEEKAKKSSSGVNPFLALFGAYEKKEKSTEEKKKVVDKVRKDNYQESLVREYAAENARKMAFTIFDVYKKAHGMASHPSPFD